MQKYAATAGSVNAFIVGYQSSKFIELSNNPLAASFL